jgi:uncharacterized membrane protein YeiH
MPSRIARRMRTEGFRWKQCTSGGAAVSGHLSGERKSVSVMGYKAICMCTASCGLVMSNCRPSVPVIKLLSLFREMDSTSSSLTVALVAWDAVRRRSWSLLVLAPDVVLCDVYSLCQSIVSGNK